MTAMGERDLEREGRERARKFAIAIGAAVVGTAFMATGFALGSSRTGDAATQAGMLAGMGFAFTVGGAAIAWRMRPNYTGWRTESASARRERLQTRRTQLLWVLPMISALFLFQGLRGLNEIIGGSGSWSHYLSASLPVLYAWVATAVAMGWDYQARTERRFLEDELTVVLRARAIGLAFFVLMAGVTVALGLALWRPPLAILALPVVLTAAGATAAIRFVWLDREAGKDG